MAGTTGRPKVRRSLQRFIASGDLSDRQVALVCEFDRFLSEHFPKAGKVEKAGESTERANVDDVREAYARWKSEQVGFVESDHNGDLFSTIGELERRFGRSSRNYRQVFHTAPRPTLSFEVVSGAPVEALTPAVTQALYVDPNKPAKEKALISGAAGVANDTVNEGEAFRAGEVIPPGEFVEGVDGTRTVVPFEPKKRGSVLRRFMMVASAAVITGLAFLGTPTEAVDATADNSGTLLDTFSEAAALPADSVVQSHSVVKQTEPPTVEELVLASIPEKGYAEGEDISGGVTKNDITFRLSSKSNVARSQALTDVGHALFNGDYDFSQDEKLAFDATKRATELNPKNGQAWFNLGYMVYTSKTAYEDDDTRTQTAAKYLTNALENGYDRARNILETMVKRGWIEPPQVLQDMWAKEAAAEKAMSGPGPDFETGHIKASFTVNVNCPERLTFRTQAFEKMWVDYEVKTGCRVVQPRGV